MRSRWSPRPHRGHWRARRARGAQDRAVAGQRHHVRRSACRSRRHASAPGSSASPARRPRSGSRGRLHRTGGRLAQRRSAPPGDRAPTPRARRRVASPPRPRPPPLRERQPAERPQAARPRSWARLQRATAPPPLTITSWTPTRSPLQGCQPSVTFASSIAPVLWVLWWLVVRCWQAALRAWRPRARPGRLRAAASRSGMINQRQSTCPRREPVQTSRALSMCSGPAPPVGSPVRRKRAGHGTRSSGGQPQRRASVPLPPRSRAKAETARRSGRESACLERRAAGRRPSRG